MNEFDNIIKVEHRIAAQIIHLKYLKYLYNSVEEIFNENLNHPTHYINVSCKNPESQLETILNLLARKLIANDKIAIKIFKTNNQIIVQTN